MPPSKVCGHELMAPRVQHFSAFIYCCALFITDTDRVVFSQQPTAPPPEGVTTKQVRKKVLKKKEPLAVEMEDVSPVSHHSHSTVGG